MKSTLKKWISVLLALVLVLQLMPTSAFATDGDDEIIIIGEEELPVDPEEDPEDEEISLIGEEEEIELLDDDLVKDVDSAYVTGEVEELREANEKHFRLSDGSFVALSYSEAVHYLDVDGHWQEIDNSLQQEGLDYVARAGEVEKRFAGAADEEYLFWVSVEGYSLSVSPAEFKEQIGIDEPEETAEPEPEPEPTFSPEESEEPEPVGEDPEDPVETDPGYEIIEIEDNLLCPASDGRTIRNDSELIILIEEPEPIGEDPEDEEEETIPTVTPPTDEKVHTETEPADERSLEEAGFVALSRSEVVAEVDWDRPENSMYRRSVEEASDLKRLSSQLSYRNIYPGVSLIYKNHGYTVKESIVIEAKQESYSYSFLLKTENLKAALEEDGGISLFNEAGKEIMRIPAPFMFDADGAASHDVHYSLKKYADGYLLTVEANSAWINDADRAFPVTIDPSIVSTITSTDSLLKGTFVKEGSPNSTNGLSQNLGLGYDEISSIKEAQIYLAFSSLPSLPSNAIITKSTLELCQKNYSPFDGSGLYAGAYEVSDSKPSGSTYSQWISGFTWNNRPATFPDLIDYNNLHYVYGEYYYLWDLTRLVKEWYENSNSTRVICLKTINIEDYGPGTGVYAYATLKACGAADSGFAPYFSIYYRNDVGLEDYFSYQAHSIDRAGAAYVCDHNRQLTLVKTDMTSASTYLPVSISHVYNSAYAGKQVSDIYPIPSLYYSTMQVGQGWKLSFQQAIYKECYEELQYYDADGTVHYFLNISPNVYSDEDGLGLTLSDIGNNCYIMEDRYGNSKFFESGWLKYEEDANGCQILYVRNYSTNRVESIARKSGDNSQEQLVTLSYDGNFLSSITDASGTTSFYYTDGKLTQIEHPDGTTVNYDYFDSGRIKSAKDNESGYKVQYNYSYGKLRQIQEISRTGYVGSSVKISGNNGITVYQDCGKDRTLETGDDLLTSKVFDYGGHTITSYTASITQGKIYWVDAAKYSVSNGTSSKNNRLMESCGVGSPPVADESKNLLLNGEMDGNKSHWIGGSYASPNTLGTDIFTGAIKLTGSIGSSVYTYQVVQVDEPASQTYMLSAWAKSTSVALRDDTRKFDLRAKIFYTDGEDEVQSISFCADSTEWQFVALPIVPKHTGQVDRISVALWLKNNPATAYVTNFCLTKEPAAAYKYNDAGDLVSISVPDNNEATFRYDGANLIYQVTRGNGTYNYSYDNRHRVTQITNDGLTMGIEYTIDGNVESTTLSGSGTNDIMSTSATYTNYGNLLQTQTDPRGNVTTFTYGTAISKLTGQPTKVTDALNHSTITSYNPFNGRVTGSSTGDVSLAYTYGNGALTGMTRTADSSTQVYSMGYNGWNRLTSISVGDYLLASYTYTSHNGQLSKMSYGNGQYETYTYDELERVTEVQYNNNDNNGTNPGVGYTYTGEGTLGTLTDYANRRVYNYSYDNLYRLTGMNETFTDANEVSHPVQSYSVSYDGANRVSGYSYTVYPAWGLNNNNASVNRSYSYGYNSNDGSLSTMNAPYADYSLNYDGLKRLSSTEVLNYNDAALYTKNYSYLPGAGTNATTTLVASYSVNKPTNGTFASYTYTYDALGNITGISGSTTASYTYDALNQLTGATQDNVAYAYTYDHAGNILSKTVGNDTIDYTYGDIDGWKDLLTGYDEGTIEYDEIGNPTKWYDDAQMTWVNGRRLESITAVSGVHDAMSFTYDADGLRLTKTVGSGNSAVEHRYTWQGDKLISEFWDGKKLEFYYGPDGSIDGFAYKASPNGTFYVYYYVKNLQGDVVKIINKNGEVKAEYTYDPFGKVLTATGTMADVNPIRYRGYYYDTETGFYYLQSRYYDPNICRFINADGLASTGQGFLGCNMFAYCNNNPVLLVDSEGQNPIVIWYYLFLYSEYGFIHKAVQAHIVSHSGQRVEMEVTVLRQNGTLGRADLVDKNTHAVWEVKHGAGSGAAAFAQATSYINATIKSKKMSGDISGYGSAGAFSGSFWINCFGESYFVYYVTPTPGVVTYQVVQLKKKMPDEREVIPFTPRKEKREQLSLVYAAEIAVVTFASIATGFMLGRTLSTAGGGGDRLMKLLD